MRTLAWIVAVLVALVTLAPRATRADPPTTMIVRNHCAAPVRVQIALGPAFPCDASENRMMLDAILPAGATRTLPLEEAIIACARATSPGSTLSWGPSRWVRGGYRCRGGRGGPCWRDPSVPIVFDVVP